MADKYKYVPPKFGPYSKKPAASLLNANSLDDALSKEEKTKLAEFKNDMKLHYDAFPQSLLHAKQKTQAGAHYKGDIRLIGVMMAYHLSPENAVLVRDFGTGLRNIIPGVVTYDLANAHVKNSEYLMTDESEEQTSLVIKTLSDAVAEALPRMSPIEIKFNKPIANHSTVLAPGDGSEYFFRNQIAIWSALKSVLDYMRPEQSTMFNKEALNRSPMQHIPLARFNDTYTVDELIKKGFFGYLSDVPEFELGTMHLLSVTPFHAGKQGFRFDEKITYDLATKQRQGQRKVRKKFMI